MKQRQPLQLGDHYTIPRLLRFTFPSMVMMIFTSIYGIVDGLFVSNFVGKTPFAAINLIWPFLQMFGVLGFMLGSGGSALVSIAMGEGKKQRARELFSLMVYTTFLGGAAMAGVGFLILPKAAEILGATGSLLTDAVLYGRIILLAMPFFMLTNLFQTFFITAEKPKLGLLCTFGAGVTNMVLDYVLIVPMKLGLAGAALATMASQVFGGLVPLIYFGRRNSSLLRLTRCRVDWRALGHACVNGSSELMTNISMSLVSMLYNAQLLRFAGEEGVAAMGVIMYVNFIFVGIFIGYAIGSAPVIGFHYGAKNRDELRGLLRRSAIILGTLAIVLTGVSLLASWPLTAIFVGFDPQLHRMTHHGFLIYSLSFLMCGFSIFGSSFFTALGDGMVSALISFLRTLLFQLAAIFLLPALFGLDGVWIANVAAETLAAVCSVMLVLIFRKKYGYL